MVWIGWHFFGHDNRVYSSGRLSAAHAVLEKQCAACHVQQAGGFSATATDSACLACHDGPPHHETVAKSEKLACAECHVEHRGRMNLAAASNQTCAECHGNLSAASATTNFARHIRSFEDGHPEFAALRGVAGAAPRDSGTIKLNHALHMRAIRSGPNRRMVQLDCSDCHRTSNAASWRFADAAYARQEPPVPLQLQHSYEAKDEFVEPISRGLMAARSSGRELMAPPRFDFAHTTRRW